MVLKRKSKKTKAQKKKPVKKREATSVIPDNQDDNEKEPLVTNTDANLDGNGHDGVDSKIPEPVKKIIPDEPIQDRMIKRKQRNQPCPKCGNHPNKCMMRRHNYVKFICRKPGCKHVWEDKD